MKDKHIIEVLDHASIADLSASELSEVQAHARDCVSCRDAYEAAQLSGLILKSRAQVVIEPSPFFETRVMAALRERSAVESVPAMLRLWSSARALVSSMAVTTAALAVLSFVLPAPVTSGIETASVDSAESVILDQSYDEQMTYAQVLGAIYDEDDEAR
ncbi:MAG TPA: hypothetical protein VFR12_04445 [Pyrinomonadaceae bacterium]|nr:hypothetical protein [Pyrinomonadaceae bacterium]